MWILANNISSVYPTSRWTRVISSWFNREIATARKLCQVSWLTDHTCRQSEDETLGMTPTLVYYIKINRAVIIWVTSIYKKFNFKNTISSKTNCSSQFNKIDFKSKSAVYFVCKRKWISKRSLVSFPSPQKISLLSSPRASMLGSGLQFREFCFKND